MTQEVTMSLALVLTPKLRFAAQEYAQSLPYDYEHGVRWCIDTDAKVEGFPASYTAEEVTAATELLCAAATAQITGFQAHVWDVEAHADGFLSVLLHP
jgi:hypothetical protein